jgi:Cys-tRNA(Pro)/Cys-tRNA(Cys) deacylase
MRNNVTRMLESKNINFSAFELSGEKMSAIEVAERLNIPPQQVYKTIVVKRIGKGKPILALVASDREVNLKKVAAAIGEKKVMLPTQKEAEEITGLQAGGISPLALINRGYQVIIDSSANARETINISGGQRSLNISISPKDIQELTNGMFADIQQDVL